MAVGRMIPVVTFEDPAFGNLSFEAMMMFVGIVVFADNLGRLRGNAVYLANRIFPYKNMSSKKATAIRDEVVKNIKSVSLYKVENEEFLQLTKWKKYQKLRNDRTFTSDFPSMDDACHTNDIPMTDTCHMNRKEGNRKEKKGKEGKCEGKPNLPLRGRDLVKTKMKELGLK